MPIHFVIRPQCFCQTLFLDRAVGIEPQGQGRRDRAVGIEPQEMSHMDRAAGIEPQG